LGASGGASGGAAGANVSAPSWAWGGSSTITPYSAQAFTAPSYQDAQSDPGYQFALQQGQQALTNSASANGGLLGGAMGKALIDYGQNAAAQQYQNVYNRALQTNQTNNSNNLAAYQSNVNAQLGVGNLGVSQQNANTSAQGVANSYALGQGQLGYDYWNAGNNYNLGMLQANNSYNLGLGNLQQGWANYGLNADQQNFGQQYSLANMGLNGAGQAGNYGSQYANGASNAYTGIGNAQAGGAIGQGNAYGGALGSLGNGLMGYGLYQGMYGGNMNRTVRPPNIPYTNGLPNPGGIGTPVSSGFGQ
jgi:hypothetical protein